MTNIICVWDWWVPQTMSTEESGFLTSVWLKKWLNDVDISRRPKALDCQKCTLLLLDKWEHIKIRSIQFIFLVVIPPLFFINFLRGKIVIILSWLWQSIYGYLVWFIDPIYGQSTSFLVDHKPPNIVWDTSSPTLVLDTYWWMSNDLIRSFEVRALAFDVETYSHNDKVSSMGTCNIS